MFSKIFNFNQLSSEVSQLEISAIKNKQHKLKKKYYLMEVVVLIPIFFVYIIAVKNTSDVLAVALLIILVLYAFIAIRVYSKAYWAISIGIGLILADQLQPTRYLNVIASVPSHFSLKDSGLPYNRPLYYLNVAVAHLVQGNFEQAQHDIEQLDIDMFSGKNRSSISISYYFLCSLLELLQGQTIDFKAIKEEMMAVATEKDFSDTTKKLKVLEAVSAIENGGVNYYFEAVEADSRLWDLFYQFYRAKNYLLDQKKDKAKQIFEELAQENNDLYFVREAKKYLEEL